MSGGGSDLSTGSTAQERDAIIRSVAHEIMNCLHVVHLGTLSLATLRDDEANLAEWAAITEQNRKRAAELVSELAEMALLQPVARHPADG